MQVVVGGLLCVGTWPLASGAMGSVQRREEAGWDVCANQLAAAAEQGDGTAVRKDTCGG